MPEQNAAPPVGKKKKKMNPQQRKVCERLLLQRFGSLTQSVAEARLAAVENNPDLPTIQKLLESPRYRGSDDPSPAEMLATMPPKLAKQARRIMEEIKAFNEIVHAENEGRAAARLRASETKKALIRALNEERDRRHVQLLSDTDDPDDQIRNFVDTLPTVESLLAMGRSLGVTQLQQLPSDKENWKNEPITTVALRIA